MGRYRFIAVVLLGLLVCGCVTKVTKTIKRVGPKPVVNGEFEKTGSCHACGYEVIGFGNSCPDYRIGDRIYICCAGRSGCVVGNRQAVNLQGCQLYLRLIDPSCSKQKRKVYRLVN